jgi:beta-phosphoglucomutase-like phosphatase (HAD superfamily)
MSQPLRAVIFDLVGVLADSEPWWNEIDAQLLAEHGVTYRGEYHQNVLGVSYRLAVEFYKKTFAISAPTEELMRRRGEIATEFFANRVGLFPKTKQVLQELREMNPPVRLGLATSSVSASARPFLDRHQLTQFFDVIVTGDEIERGKPAPDIYLRALARMEPAGSGATWTPRSGGRKPDERARGVKSAIAPNECLVIEDSLSGIAAAKAAKMRVAAIPDRRFVDPRDYEKRADYLLGNLSELPALICGVNTAS